MKKVSVVTICFNNLEGLRKTADSVLRQRRDLFEYLIIDGGSNDGSLEYIQSIRDHLDVFVSEPDRGVYDALNKGWILSKGEFIVFMNAGDTFASHDTIEMAINFLTEKVDIVYGDVYLGDQRGIYQHKKQPSRISSAWLIREVIAHQSQFISRDLLKRNNGYDLNFQIASDYAFLAKVFWKQNARFLHLPFFVCVFNTEGLSSSISKKSIIEDERRMIHNAFAPTWIRLLYYTYAQLNRWIGR
jgi:glycosyltransferase involved in cell wall biosynthesis